MIECNPGLGQTELGGNLGESSALYGDSCRMCCLAIQCWLLNQAKKDGKRPLSFR
jgi:hypothetical protein